MSSLECEIQAAWESGDASYAADLARLYAEAELSPRARWMRAMDARLLAATGDRRAELLRQMAHVADTENRAIRGGLSVVELWQDAATGGRLRSYAGGPARRMAGAGGTSLPTVDDFGGDLKSYRASLLDRMAGG